MILRLAIILHKWFFITSQHQNQTYSSLNPTSRGDGGLGSTGIVQPLQTSPTHQVVHNRLPGHCAVHVSSKNKEMV
jgi:hypothetical protein